MICVKKVIKHIIPLPVLNWYSEKCLKKEIIKLIQKQYLKFIQEERTSEEYKSKFLLMREKYKKIVVCKYFMRHIGEMCMTLYLFSLEHRYDTDTLYVAVPVTADKDSFWIPNNFLLKKIEEKVEVITPQNIGFWKWCIENHQNEFVFSNAYDWNEMFKRDMDFIDESHNFNDIISFSAKETFTALAEKKTMGLDNNEYICFFNRDNQYYKEILNEKDDDIIAKCRNSRVDYYKLMAARLFQKRIYSVRMGYKVEQKINGAGIIDYASNSRSEFMDFYLVCHGKFFVVSGSGIQLIATLFFKPMVLVNNSVLSFGGDMVTPLNPKRDLLIVKKMWNEKEQRYLTFREILDMEARYKSYELFDAYHNMGIRMQENTAEEIAEVAEEMNQRLDGVMEYTNEDEMLQKKYRQILLEAVSSSKNHYYNARMGAKFLRNNRWLLD